MKEHVVVIGIGNMGCAVAERLLASGNKVTVHNRTRGKCEALRTKGAIVANSLIEALSEANVVVSALYDQAAVREVLLADGVKPFLNECRVLNIAQTTPEEIISLSDDLAAQGCSLSEVEVIAYPDDVLNGTGDLIFAGPLSDKNLWVQFLEQLGERVHYVGELGNASKAEMAFWLPFAFQTIAMAYTVGAFEREQLPLSVLQAVLSSNTVLGIAGAESSLPAMVGREYSSAQWSVDNMVESLDVAIAYARKRGLKTGVFEAIRNLYAEASRGGFGAKDHCAVREVLIDSTS